MIQISKVPQGYHSVNPYIVIKEAEKFILFLQSVFDARKIKEINENGGYYAEVKIGDSCIMIEENKSAVSQEGTYLWVYVHDTRFIYERAIATGCTSLEAPTCKYGVDFIAKVRDPFGLCWLISSYYPSR
jgi:PhnB protein